MFGTKVVEKIKTYGLCSVNVQNLCCLVKGCGGKNGTPGHATNDSIARCVRFACRTPQNTDTHSDYVNLTFMFPYIVSIIIIDNKQDATILIYLFLISSTCFGRCFRPSSGAYRCNYSCSPMLLLAGVATAASSNIGGHYQKL